MSNDPVIPFSSFGISLEQAKQMMAVYNSYMLWRRVRNLPIKEPTPEELDEYNRTVLLGKE